MRAPEPGLPPGDLDLFAAETHLPAPRRTPWLVTAGLLHVVVVAALVLVPLWQPDLPFAAGFDPIRVLIYAPPPPPPPPLPKGSPSGGRARATAPAAPTPVPTPGGLEAPVLRAPVQ